MATKHDKTVLFGPALTEALGLEVIEAVVDTDVLGTFSGEIARVASPLDTALANGAQGHGRGRPYSRRRVGQRTGPSRDRSSGSPSARADGRSSPEPPRLAP